MTRQEHAELLKARIRVRPAPKLSEGPVTVITAPVDGKMVKFTFLGHPSDSYIKETVAMTNVIQRDARNKRSRMLPVDDYFRPRFQETQPDLRGRVPGVVRGPTSMLPQEADRLAA